MQKTRRYIGAFGGCALLLGVLFVYVSEYTMRRVLGAVLLVSVAVLFLTTDIQATQSRKIDFSLLTQHYDVGHISPWYYLALINRIFVFPVILTVYLLYLLVQQTSIWGLDAHVWFLMLHETFLLTLTIVTGVFLVYQEEKDEQYILMRHSLLTTYRHIMLSIVLGLLSTYIIYQQTLDLGTIGLTISGIAGVLVFLVGILLVSEEDEQGDEF